jgi:hypothetical protein
VRAAEEEKMPEKQTRIAMDYERFIEVSVDEEEPSEWVMVKLPDEAERIAGLVPPPYRRIV